MEQNICILISKSAADTSVPQSFLKNSDFTGKISADVYFLKGIKRVKSKKYIAYGQKKDEVFITSRPFFDVCCHKNYILPRK